MTTAELITAIDTVADSCCDLSIVTPLRAAQTALRRLAAIEAIHECNAVRTGGGKVIYTDIRGRLLQRLLHGDFNG